jgi:hypothetical protein
MKKKAAIDQIEETLAVHIRRCDDAGNDEGLRGRCYGLALALAILTGMSTDEELWRVAGSRDRELMDAAERVFRVAK